ncbi:hypothetical protein [Nocardia neocaledoniensis]|uniref:hypothetical protein n=1 Tax=Nocardia neocaledoniensis TaxID=236511 RepID=UPI0024557B02|nr:hypothetical protein [Nocardia neocaledoniensis]
MQTAVPVANGLSTDHPIPDLPFVDDSHIPTHDARAIEAIGRLPGQPTWARFDWPRAAEWTKSPWWAFTTDPRRTDLAWCVRFHPGLGRSVVLVDNAAAGQLHEQWSNEPLLFRAGGYWWDGSHWFRPAQLWDGVAERFVNRAVPMATTVTAADLLTDRPIDPAAVPAHPGGGGPPPPPGPGGGGGGASPPRCPPPAPGAPPRGAPPPPDSGVQAGTAWRQTAASRSCSQSASGQEDGAPTRRPPANSAT